MTDKTLERLFRSIFTSRMLQNGKIVTVKEIKPITDLQEVNTFKDITEEIIDFYSKR